MAIRPFPVGNMVLFYHIPVFITTSTLFFCCSGFHAFSFLSNGWDRPEKVAEVQNFDISVRLRQKMLLKRQKG